MKFQPSAPMILVSAWLLALSCALPVASWSEPDPEPVLPASMTATSAAPFQAYGNDFDADAISDFGVFDANTGHWYVLAATGSVVAWAAPWGWSGAIPVRGDYDGDGRADLAVFDSHAGTWFIWSLAQGPLTWNVPWGWTGAVPVPGDYDGDGRSDLAVFDPNTGSWFVWSLANGLVTWNKAWGWPGAIPVPGDYNGDGRADLAVFDNNTGAWFVWSLAGGMVAWNAAWGWPGAVPVEGDFDGDGRSDLAVFDRYTGTWYVWSLAAGPLVWNVAWGWPGAIPVSGDFNGDRRSDLAVFDSGTGAWYAWSLAAGLVAWNQAWGWPGALPIGEPISLFYSGLAALEVVASPTNGGTVTGSGLYAIGSQARITASASAGWTFTGWHDGNTQSSRHVTVPAGGATYIASFAQNMATLTVTASPAEGGTVTGSGTYPAGTSVVITATANSGWTFTGWHDANTQAVRTVTVPSGGAAYTAFFIRETAGRLTLVGRYAGAGGHAMTIQSNYVFLADATNGWRILNAANPAAPTLVSHTIPAGSCNGVAVTGSYAYISTSGSGNEGLLVYDIRNPFSPVRVAAVSGQYNGLRVSGGYLYAAQDSPTLKVFDLGSPSSPIQAGQYLAGRAGELVAVAGSFVYVSDALANVLILNVSGGPQPVLGGVHACDSQPAGLALGGAFLYVANGANGLEIADVSVPALPLRISRYAPLGSVSRCVAVSGNRCYLASADGAARVIEVLNVSSPAAPARLSYVVSAGAVQDLAIAGSYLYAAEGAAGLSIYRIE